MNLKGKNIFISGGSRGIGAACAIYANKLGANVAITYNNNESKALELVEKLSGSQNFLINMDLEKMESIKEACSKTLGHFDGVVDGVVNNAGVVSDQIILRMKEAEFSRVLDVNLKGTFYVSKEFVKSMVKNKQGSVVHITSIVGQMGQVGQSNYSASKAGIEAFSKSLAREFARKNIRSNCVSPGFVETDMTKNINQSVKEKLLSQIPLNRVADVSEIAHPVCFLLSSDASYITGQTISVNGGMYMC